MQRIVAGLGQLLIGRDGEKHVGRLAGDLELEEVVVFEDLGVAQGAFDHRLGAGLAVFLEEIALKRAGIDPDAHRAAMVLGRLDDLAHPLGRADIAGVDAQAGGAAFGRLDRAFVVEMDVGDDRHLDLAHDVLQRQCRFLVGTGHPDDIGASPLQRLHLLDGGLDVAGDRVGHRLHGDRRIAADRHLADVNFAALTAVDVAVGPDAHGLNSRVVGTA